MAELDAPIKILPMQEIDTAPAPQARTSTGRTRRCHGDAAPWLRWPPRR